MPPVLPAGMVSVPGNAPPAPPLPPADNGDATAHEVADGFKWAVLGFAVLGAGLAIAGCFFPPLELAAASSFSAAMAAGAGTMFLAADVSLAVGMGLDTGVAVVHPTPANRAVVVGDVVGLALGYGIGKAVGAGVSKYGPQVTEVFTKQMARLLARERVIRAPTTQFGKLRMAYEYYRQAGWDKAKIAGHLQGIDFSKPVELVELPANKLAGQVQANPAWKGNYFAEPGTPPTKLGVNPQGQLPDGTVVNKVETLYSTTEKTTVLRSSAAPVKDTEVV